MAIDFFQHTFPHGLQLLAQPMPEAHTAALGFFVNTGARDEARPVMGVSHFLEHMMFKGTARRTAEDVNREFDEMGADYNAFTSHEATVYYAHVLPEFVPRAADLLADMLRPALREADFDIEKNVILEEISMYEDRPQWRLQDHLLEHFYQDHPLAFRVLGTSQSITDLRVQAMRDYFNQRYSPDNIILTAAGRLDLPRLIEDITRLTSHWQPTGTRRAHGMIQPRPQDRTLHDPKLSRAYLGLLCPGPSAQDPQRYAAAVLAEVLGDDEGSWLYWDLIDPGLADEAAFSHEAMDQVGSYLAYASCDPERAEQVEGILLGAMDRVASPIEAAEVERAKNKLATRLTLKGERPAGRMMDLGSQWLALGRYVPLEEELAKLMAVTTQDVQAAAGDGPLQPRTLVRLLP